MVRFYILGQGLRADVVRRYESYLKNSEPKMHAMLVCSLLNISSLELRDNLLEKMCIIEYVYELENAILSYQELGRTWKTLHPRWDMEFLSFLCNENDRSLLSKNKKYLSRALESIFNVQDETTSALVIKTLYSLSTDNISGYKNIPIEITENLLGECLPDHISNWTQSILYGIFIAKAYYDLHRYADAVNRCNKAIELNPEYAAPRYNRGLMLILLEKYKEAILEIDKAIKLDPNYVEGRYNKGYALGNLGRHHEAIKVYDEVLELDPNYSDAWNYRGLSLCYIGKFEEALDSIQNAINIQPDYDRAWYNQGIAFASLGRLDEALECFDMSIGLDPNYSEAWYSRSRCKNSLGHKSEEILSDLGKSIKIGGDEYKERAREDWNFANIRDDERFKSLTRK